MTLESPTRRSTGEVLRLGRVTRDELATSTGISKPTISDSARRLEAAGLLCATGSQTDRRGRVATVDEFAERQGGCWR